MHVFAAGVLKTEGALEKAAGVFEDAGFGVPYGYIEHHYGEETSDRIGYDITDSLRLWVENEAERIGQVAESIGFYLAARGKLSDEAEKYLQHED